MIDADNRARRAAAVLAAGGVPAENAALVDADLRGIHSHGVTRPRIYSIG